jgi:hypothetical protein
MPGWTLQPDDPPAPAELSRALEDFPSHLRRVEHDLGLCASAQVNDVVALVHEREVEPIDVVIQTGTSA